MHPWNAEANDFAQFLERKRYRMCNRVIGMGNRQERDFRDAAMGVPPYTSAISRREDLAIPISTATNKAGKPVTVGGAPFEIAIP
jgi:hypothetical protein